MMDAAPAGQETPPTAATFVLQDDLGPQPLEQLFHATRVAVEGYYAANEAGQSTAATGAQQQQPQKAWTLRQQLLASRAAASAKAADAVDFASKTNRELVELLRHRDEAMKLNAAAALEKKVHQVPLADPARAAAAEELTKNGLRPLVEILNSSASTTPLLLKAITILIAIFNDDVSDRLRQVGGLGPVLGHVASTDVALVKQALILVTELALNEANQDGFRRTGLLDKVVPALSHPDRDVRLSAVEALINLSVSAKNQEVIAKAEALPRLMVALKSTDDQFQLQSLLLLYNLSQCPVVKAGFTPEYMMLLLPFADARRLREEPRERNLAVQRYVLATLAGLATFEKHQRKLGELGAVGILLPYLDLVEGPTPLDADVLSSVLETLDHLLLHKDNQYAFFKANGHERVLAILSRPQAFSESVVIEAASIISHLSAAVNSQVFSSIGVKQLHSLLDMYPQNATMHLLVARTFAALAQDDQSARVLLANQAAPTLAKFILQSRVKQVLEYSCSALAKLAAFDSVRAFIIQSGLVSKLISFLGYSQQALLIPVTDTICRLAAHEDGLAAIMEYGGLLPLISMLQSPQVEIQEMALAAIGKVVLSDPSSRNRLDLVHRGGLKEIIALMTSPSAAVQLLVLGILKSLAKYEDMREPFLQSGLMEKLRLLAEHPNVQKENSELRQSLRMLLLAVKNLQEQTPPASPAGLGLASPALRASAAGVATAEEQQILDTLLASLTREQLIELIKEAIAQGASLAQSIRQFVHLNIAAGKQAAPRERAIPAAPAPAEVAATATAAPTPPSAPTAPAPASLASSPSGPPPPPPPASSSAADGPSLTALQQGKARLRSAADRAPNAPLSTKASGGKSLDKMSVLDELIRRNQDPGYKALKHVDIEAELAQRRQEKHQRSSRRLLKDIEAGKRRQFILVSEGTEEGKKYWKKDPEWYVEEVQKALLLDPQMMRLVFGLLETDASFTPFEVTHRALADAAATSAEDLAQALLKVGFTLKSRHVIKKNPTIDDASKEESEEPMKEYTHIILPADLPVKYILKTILVTAQPALLTANGRALSNVDNTDGAESPLPPAPSSPLPTPAGGVVSLASSSSYESSLHAHRSSPSMLATGSLASSRSFASVPTRTPTSASTSTWSPATMSLSSSSSAAAASSSPRPSLGSSNSYADGSGTTSTIPFGGLATRSQPIQVIRTEASFVLPNAPSLSAEFANLLEGIDDLVAGGGGGGAAAPPPVTSRETCGLCKLTFPADQTQRIANKNFCGPCHQRVIALARQKDIKLG